MTQLSGSLGIICVFVSQHDLVSLDDQYCTPRFGAVVTWWDCFKFARLKAESPTTAAETKGEPRSQNPASLTLGGWSSWSSGGSETKQEPPGNHLGTTGL